MRNLIASLILATSTLAHGFWLTGNKLHHFFGAVLLATVAVIVLPVSLVKRAMRKTQSRNGRENE